MSQVILDLLYNCPTQRDLPEASLGLLRWLCTIRLLHASNCSPETTGIRHTSWEVG